MYQKVILIGRIGQKNSSYTKTQKPVAQYSLATTKSIKDKQTGDWNEHTEWHRLVSFNRCAEHVNNKLESGDLIQVEGELRTRKWQDQNGSDRYTTEIVVYDFPKKLPRYFHRDGLSASAQQTAAQQQPSQLMAQAAGQEFMNQGQFDTFDDDIPF
ncbi:single-stranded DNA-binding protein [Microbulbifer sp. THAF38]|uniref:single-stranded DNA-binding protein n=1 Tax=Microbulbifer sp. THAF38 TaxID=2587856 RepID=UPI0012682DEE|nr:single-stranded DNA-binding protein [Microbulbifer sp. THAF38]QFT57096.1 Single-stranded DNA-binding protein [Microbulbifer sp. THAF38]